jgi:hypothetical protein
LVIKKALYEDLKEILQLQNQTYLSKTDLYNDYNIKPLVQTLDKLKQDFSKQIFLNAVIDDNIKYFLSMTNLKPTILSANEKYVENFNDEIFLYL